MTKIMAPLSPTPRNKVNVGATLFSKPAIFTLGWYQLCERELNSAQR